MSFNKQEKSMKIFRSEPVRLDDIQGWEELVIGLIYKAEAQYVNSNNTKAVVTGETQVVILCNEKGESIGEELFEMAKDIPIFKSTKSLHQDTRVEMAIKF